MIGRNIELVLGIQRRSRMIRTRMLDIRLEAGDVLLLFGYDADMRELRNSRDLLLLDWSTAELPDIRKSPSRHPQITLCTDYICGNDVCGRNKPFAD